MKNTNYDLYKKINVLSNPNSQNNQNNQINPSNTNSNFGLTNNKMFPNSTKYQQSHHSQSHQSTMREAIEQKKLNQSQLFTNLKHNFYCPHCEHCNSDLNDDQLEVHIASIQESKNIIEKTFEYILRTDYLKGNAFNLFNTKTKEKDNDIEVIIYKCNNFRVCFITHQNQLLLKN